MEEAKIKDISEIELASAIETLILDLGHDTGNRIDQMVLHHTKMKIVNHLSVRMPHVDFMEVVRMFNEMPTGVLGKLYKNSVERFSLADFCQFWGNYSSKKEQSRIKCKASVKIYKSWETPDMVQAKQKSISSRVFDENVYYTDQELSDNFPDELKKIKDIRVRLKQRSIGKNIRAIM